MLISPSETSTRLNSGRFHTLTNLRVASLPEAYCTITSVPPAIGNHAPGCSASSDTTADRLPGATNSYSAGSDLISHSRDLRLLQRPHKFAHIPYTGRDCRKALPLCPPA